MTCARLYLPCDSVAFSLVKDLHRAIHFLLYTAGFELSSRERSSVIIFQIGPLFAELEMFDD